MDETIGTGGELMQLAQGLDATGLAVLFATAVGVGLVLSLLQYSNHRLRPWIALTPVSRLGVLLVTFGALYFVIGALLPSWPVTAAVLWLVGPPLLSLFVVVVALGFWTELRLRRIRNAHSSANREDMDHG